MTEEADPLPTRRRLRSWKRRLRRAAVREYLTRQIAKRETRLARFIDSCGCDGSYGGCPHGDPNYEGP